MIRVNNLLAGHAHRRFFAGVFVDNARFLVAMQIKPAAHIIRLDKIFRHHGGADQGLNTADDAFTGNPCFKQNLIHKIGKLGRPIARRDLNAHCF